VKGSSSPCLSNQFPSNDQQSSRFLPPCSTQDAKSHSKVPVWLSGVCVELASMMKDFLHGGIYLSEA
jgi:hypothetical protein